MLSYERYNTLVKTLTNNIERAGCEFDLFVLDQGSKDYRVLRFLSGLHGHEYIGGHKNLGNVSVLANESNVGIAAGFNELMRRASGYDFYQFIANDIMEPDNWLIDKVRAIQSIPNSGMVSIPVGEHALAPVKMVEQWVYPGDVIGQYMISREVWEKVGAFREDWGHYSPVDLDYNRRCVKAGFVNYYLSGKQAEHLEQGDRSLYGYNKDEAISRTWSLFSESLKDEDYHIPPGEYTMNAKEHL